jgi:hypothetical protein
MKPKYQLRSFRFAKNEFLNFKISKKKSKKFGTSIFFPSFDEFSIYFMIQIPHHFKNSATSPFKKMKYAHFRDE